MPSAHSHKWPSEATLRKALQAVEKVTGSVAGVQVFADGSFIVLTDADAEKLDDKKASRKMAEAIRGMAG